jgi:hypothetical protein
MNGSLSTALVFIVCLVLGACGSKENRKAHTELDAVQEAYKPGMGDLMSALQLRHAKIWYAGQAQNWALAKFELHEIDETFERIARWHPVEDETPVAPLLKAHTQSARAALEESVAQKNSVALVAAFDQLTRGCNGCHQSMEHGFIVIQRPSTPPVTNQRWGDVLSE